MKIRFSAAKFRHLAIALIVLLTVSASLAQNSTPWSQDTSPLPAPTGAINDYAGVLDAATKQALEAKLKKFKETTNPQVEIGIAIVKTTGGREIFDYSLAVARGWGIGSKEDDNPSALLFIAIDDRKYYTQVSRNLEDELPDGVVGGLQRQFLVPEFKKANYSKGISDTIDAYISTIESYQNGTPTKAAAPVKKRSTDDTLYSVFCCLAILLGLGVIIYSNVRKPNKNDKDRWGGGGFGGGGGGVLPWIIAAGSGGSSSSSDSSWGGSSGGGSDWGGFGGGGDFGGGGAGGGW